MHLDLSFSFKLVTVLVFPIVAERAEWRRRRIGVDTTIRRTISRTVPERIDHQTIYFHKEGGNSLTLE